MLTKISFSFLTTKMTLNKGLVLDSTVGKFGAWGLEHGRGDQIRPKPAQLENTAHFATMV
jgi:hypothetical protein